VILADIGAELASAISAAVTAAELPAQALTRASAAGTWRPAPPGAGGGPGTYATTLPFLLAEATGLDAAAIAALLAARLERVGWIRAASVTGNGYLTVAVSPRALARLAVRVAQAGDACARSTALRGLRQHAPADADLASAASWAQAWRLVTDAASGRLAAAAGAHVTFTTSPERYAPPRPATARSPVPGEGTSARAGLGAQDERGAGSVGAAVAYAGSDAIRYALARRRTGGERPIDARLSVRAVLGNPYFAVGFSHADAASVLRWAADLGLYLGAAADVDPGLLDQAAELELLQAISWLPERVAGAARRGQPDDFARYLEGLTGAYLDCRENCPALPFMGERAPRDPGAIQARLWLTAAAAAALRAGLRLLGVGAPIRV
jgi:arginyl-tRNA synthetase